uniref:Uncharacterized protein n=1 Tax=uncultured marine virus TaxID=186617 RepID=A0A0F7L3Q9_9VIRU|nr:hypothetical protein [uncultured marine virus]
MSVVLLGSGARPVCPLSPRWQPLRISPRPRRTDADCAPGLPRLWAGSGVVVISRPGPTEHAACRPSHSTDGGLPSLTPIRMGPPSWRWTRKPSSTAWMRFSMVLRVGLLRVPARPLRTSRARLSRVGLVPRVAPLVRSDWPPDSPSAPPRSGWRTLRPTCSSRAGPCASSRTSTTRPSRLVAGARRQHHRKPSARTLGAG